MLIHEVLLDDMVSYTDLCMVSLCSISFYMSTHTLREKYSEFCGPCFSAFRVNTEIYSVNLRILSECGKIRSRKIPNTYTF